MLWGGAGAGAGGEGSQVDRHCIGIAGAAQGRGAI